MTRMDAVLDAERVGVVVADLVVRELDHPAVEVAAVEDRPASRPAARCASRPAAVGLSDERQGGQREQEGGVCAWRRQPIASSADRRSSSMLPGWTCPAGQRIASSSRSRCSSSAAFARAAPAATPSTRRARLARHVEALGFRRIWVAEHHNMPTVDDRRDLARDRAPRRRDDDHPRRRRRHHAAEPRAATSSPNSSARWRRCFPGRIDLGPRPRAWHRPADAAALRRLPTDAEHFPQDVLELQAFLAPVAPGQRIEAVPGLGTEVPIYILGSSLFGAQLAAELGLPFGFASHFSPQQLDAGAGHLPRALQALGAARRPHAMVGVNVIAAETDAEARRLATSQQMSFTNILRGVPRLTQPPIDDIDAYWLPHEKFHARQMLAVQRRRERRDGAPRPRRPGRADPRRRADRRVRRLRLPDAPAIVRADRPGGRRRPPGSDAVLA